MISSNIGRSAGLLSDANQTAIFSKKILPYIFVQMYSINITITITDVEQR